MHHLLLLPYISASGFHPHLLIPSVDGMSFVLQLVTLMDEGFGGGGGGEGGSRIVIEAIHLNHL
jgi:hypothetical protein